MKKILAILSITLSVLGAVAFNTIMGGFIASVVGVNPIYGAVALNGLALTPQIVKWIAPNHDWSRSMALHSGVYVDIWTSTIEDNFYPEGSFLNDFDDMTQFVDNNSINLAEVGVVPAVYKNWDFTNPIPTIVATDVNHNKPLARFDTQNTRINAKDKVEVAYDIIASKTKTHKSELRTRCQNDAIYNVCPSSNDVFTPVLAATGGNNGLGVKRLTFEDLIALEKECNDKDFPVEGRCLVLSSQHKADLQHQDIAFFKNLTDTKNGTVFNFASFKISMYSQTPYFDKTSGSKSPFGATPTADMVKSSVFFLTTEVFKADGDVEAHVKEAKNDNEYRADTIGFHKRALYLPKRGKGLGALYSPTV